MNLFSLQGKNAVLLGGGGILGSSMAKGLADAGANVAICDLREDASRRAAQEIRTANVQTKGYRLNALDSEDLDNIRQAVMNDFGSIDILVNAVGGNMTEATTSNHVPFFDLTREALEKVITLNLMGGAILPSQIFGREMIKNPDGGVMIHISSVNAFRPLTRIAGYSAAKAAVSNFTQWLATDLARMHGEKVRVNAIAPGFFLTAQNRFLLTDPDTGELTDRGKSIISHTPMGRFGQPDDLIGTLIWLASDASKFVTGIVVPVDGGFLAFTGV